MATFTKTKTPGDSGARGLQEEQLAKPDCAICVPNWKYRVHSALGRFLVLSPAGLAIEDCASSITAARLAATWNARMGLGSRA